MLPIVVFAILFHHGIPSIAKEVGDKSNMHNIFGITLGLCIVSYAIIGIASSWFFGENVKKSVNLNWSNFHYVGGGLGHWIASTISFYTVIFPAFDVISAFPLG